MRVRSSVTRARSSILVAFIRDRFSEHRLVAVGHRVVHGGPEYAKPVRIDAGIIRALEKYVPLAPLHQPHNLAPIKAILERTPALPQVACFDTAFHRNQPPVAQGFALPKSITERGVLRYGFHGISYEYVASVLPTTTRRPRGQDRRAAPRQRRQHVRACGGAAASRARWDSPRSTDCPWARAAATSTRVWCSISWTSSGWTRGRSRSSCTSNRDCSAFRASRATCERCRKAATPPAKAAIDMFVYRIGRELGSLASALGGLDAIVFTAGIGENSAMLRERVCRDASWLGVALDSEANARGGPGISTREAA
jgi:acetate kinase